MEDFKRHKEHAFDAYIKKVLRNYARDLYRKKVRQRKHETLFSEMPPAALENIKAQLDSSAFRQAFFLGEHKIFISDEDLAEALYTLTEQHKNIILLFYFAGFNDGEISEYLKIPRSTIQWHRQKALQELKIHLNKIHKGADYNENI